MQHNHFFDYFIDIDIDFDIEMECKRRAVAALKWKLLFNKYWIEKFGLYLGRNTSMEVAHV